MSVFSRSKPFIKRASLKGNLAVSEGSTFFPLRVAPRRLETCAWKIIWKAIPNNPGNGSSRNTENLQYKKTADCLTESVHEN